MVRNSTSRNKAIKKGLYLVSTPIGNLDDITFRAVNILNKSDYILCEDTRVSKILLKRYEIQTKLISNHKFNEFKNLLRIIDLLKNDKIISMISDAGTPGISDPGAVLVNECLKENIEVTPLPGPSAVTTAMSVSGFDEKYLFYGFFPEKKKMIREKLEILSNLSFCLIFFVSPKKINKIIPYLKDYFKDRRILICREISKFYEEYTRTPVNDLQNYLKPPKGELTIVISEAKINTDIKKKLDELDKKKIKKIIKISSIKDIVNLISKEKDISKKDIYNFCLKVKNEK